MVNQKQQATTTKKTITSKQCHIKTHNIPYEVFDCKKTKQQRKSIQNEVQEVNAFTQKTSLIKLTVNSKNKNKNNKNN